MKINNISELARYNALQSLSNMNRNLPVSSSETLFPMMFDEMLKNSEVKAVKEKLKNSKARNNNSKTTNVLNTLSLQPQQMARMIQLMAQQSAFSGLSNIGSAGNGYYGRGSMFGGDSYMSLMLGFMLGKMSQE